PTPSAAVPLPCLFASCFTLRRPLSSPLFPYTTLFRSLVPLKDRDGREIVGAVAARPLRVPTGTLPGGLGFAFPAAVLAVAGAALDRKSTRLNSSHVSISYAVFCLKKKKDFKPYLPSSF